MDNIAEREQPKPERVIRLGEEFQLFNPKYTTRIPDTHARIPSRYYWYDSDHFLLKLREDVILNYRAVATENKEGLGFTPFNPDLGYKADNNDYDPKSRSKKISSQYLPDNIKKLLPLKKLSIIENSISYGSNEIETMVFLKGLRLVLDFKETRLRFEGKPGRIISLAYVNFFDYYPSDLGPMPLPEPEPSSSNIPVGEGYSILLPDDPQKLAQIRARFVLAEEEPQEK